ncbi:MAG: MerR family transcriptional regulator [Clostridium sp.]
MTIKEASEVSGVSVDNLRYYERIGLIPKVPRNSSGFREYDEVSLRWITFVLNFKRAGVSLEKIIEYVSLAQIGDETKAARREILLEAKGKLEESIRSTQESLDVVNYKLENFYNRCEPITKTLVEDTNKC